MLQSYLGCIVKDDQIAKLKFKMAIIRTICNSIKVGSDRVASPCSATDAFLEKVEVYL